MCAGCGRAYLKLADAGYTKDKIEELLWSITPFPIDDALPLITRFLKVRRKNRNRWIRKFHNRCDRALDALMKEEKEREQEVENPDTERFTL